YRLRPRDADVGHRDRRVQRRRLAAIPSLKRPSEREERVMESNVIEEQGRIAFVQSCWHRDIVDECRDSFLAEVGARGVAADQVDLFEVTGAFEVALHG